MFTPSELEKIPIELESRMADLELSIMEDIIRRIQINNEITRSADWQIHRLIQIGESKAVLKKKLAGLLDNTTKDIDSLYRDVVAQGYARDEKLYKTAGKQFIPFKENKELQQLIQATIIQTKSQMTNITQSLGFMIDKGGKLEFTELSKFLQQTLDNAVLEITTGAFDYNTTLKKVVSQMTKSGLRTVDYSTGFTSRIEVAARRALMTGVTQVTNQINEMNANELDTEYFEVSWHGTARPSHQEWQGKVYSKQELVEICGLGSVTGLCGANCYHSYYPFIKGISERTYTDKQLEEMNAKENEVKTHNGRDYTAYEASQRQRQLETLMRKQRQDIKLLNGGNVAEDDLINIQAKYRGTMAQYKKFSDEIGLPQQKERIYIDGLGEVA